MTTLPTHIPTSRVADPTLPRVSDALPAALPREPASRVTTRQAFSGPSNDRISAAPTTARPRADIPLQRLSLSDISAAERGQARIAVPVAAQVHAFPQTLVAWEEALQREATRPVDTALAARVLDEVRNKGLGDIGQTHGEAMARVGDTHVEQWRAALGLNPAEVALMRANARTVGRLVPTSSTLFNLVNYGVLPWLTVMGSKTPLVNAGIAIASAGIAQPVATTLIQTPVIAALDTWRKKRGHAVALDGAVNARRTPAQVAEALGTVTSDIESIAQRLGSTTREIAANDHAIQQVFDHMAAAWGLHDASPAQGDVERSQHLLARLDEDADTDRAAGFRAQLVALGHRQLESHTTDDHLRAGLVLKQAEQKELSDSLRMSVGMLDRQKRSTSAQEWTRILRAASALVSVAGKGVEKLAGSAPTLYPTGAAVGMAVAALMAQHFAAGRDEQLGASDVEEKLNLLYGRDYLTEEGRQALVDGLPLAAAHVEPDGLRKLAPGAATQMLTQVTTLVALHRSVLDEADPANTTALQAFDRDLAALADGQLTRVTPGAETHRLLHEVMAGGANGHPIVFAGRQGWNKMTTLEMSAQLGQRLGLAWLGLGLGNVGSTAISRVITAALGGPGVASLQAQFGAAVLATASGVANARFAWMPVAIKNERRAEPDRVGFLSQLGHSLVAPVWTWRQSSAAAGALSAAAGDADAPH